MKNGLEDLHNHLFAQLERLSDEGIKGEALKEEVSRAKAMTSVCEEIVSAGRLALDIQTEFGGLKPQVPDYLRLKDES